MITLSSNGMLGLDLTRDSSIQDNILLSLSTPLGAFFQRPDFGSELHLLKRGKLISGKTENLAISMVRNALQWMIDLGLISTVEVQASISSPGRLGLVVIAKSGSDSIRVDYWIPVPNKDIP